MVGQLLAATLDLKQIEVLTDSIGEPVCLPSVQVSQWSFFILG
jgi:hypothetical protein